MPTRKKEVVTETTTATTQPKTLAEKLAAAEALVAKYKREIAAEAIKNDIAKDDDVTFLFGRGEKRRTLAGTIAGIKDDETQGKIVAILVTGDDGMPETYRVNVRDVLTNKTADARRAAEPVAGEAPADADPLEVA